MIPGKKILLANILYSSNFLNLFRRLPLKNKLIVLNYHRIRPDDPNFFTPFDDGTFTIGASQFAVQVGWLKQNARIFSEKDLINGVHLREKPSKPGILITFDDGYRDNYEIAYPILKDHNVPATFFIPTKLIHSRQLGWWDLIAYLIKHSPRPDIRFEGERFSLEGDRRHAIDFFHRKMKLEKYERTRHLIEDLRDICEVDFPGEEIQDQQLLTWDQVMTMAEDLITIGSHTHTHRVLATLDPTSQKEELILSKLVLEQKLGRRVDSVAYPVGGPEHFTEETRLIAIECGYRIGFTCNTGVNVWEIEDLLTVKRVSGLLEDIRTVSAIVILPDVFMWNKAESIH
ncbi:MAG: polysaccharide deacetylase family protein, partial [Pseudomonadota bacterium]